MKARLIRSLLAGALTGFACGILADTILEAVVSTLALLAALNLEKDLTI